MCGQALSTCATFLQFNDPIPTDETHESGASEMLAACEALVKLRKKFFQLKQRLVAVPRHSKPKQHRRMRWEMGAARGGDFCGGAAQSRCRITR